GGVADLHRAPDGAGDRGGGGERCGQGGGSHRRLVCLLHRSVWSSPRGHDVRRRSGASSKRRDLTARLRTPRIEAAWISTATSNKLSTNTSRAQVPRRRRTS